MEMDDKPKKPKLTTYEQRRGIKRLDVTLDREAAIALLFLRRHSGKSFKAIIEELLLAERERVLRA